MKRTAAEKKAKLQSLLVLALLLGVCGCAHVRPSSERDNGMVYVAGSEKDNNGWRIWIQPKKGVFSEFFYTSDPKNEARHFGRCSNTTDSITLFHQEPDGTKIWHKRFAKQRDVISLVEYNEEISSSAPHASVPTKLRRDKVFEKRIRALPTFESKSGWVLGYLFGDEFPTGQDMCISMIQRLKRLETEDSTGKDIDYYAGWTSYYLHSLASAQMAEITTLEKRMWRIQVVKNQAMIYEETVDLREVYPVTGESRIVSPHPSIGAEVE